MLFSLHFHRQLTRPDQTRLALAGERMEMFKMDKQRYVNAGDGMSAEE